MGKQDAERGETAERRSLRWLGWSIALSGGTALALVAFVLGDPLRDAGTDASPNGPAVIIERGFSEDDGASIPGRGMPASRLRVAVAPVVSAGASLKLYRGFVDWLGRQVGREGVLIQRASYPEVNALLRQGECELAFVCTYPYVLGRADFGLLLVAAPVVRGHSTYRSVLIVPRDSGAETLADLAGKRFAVADLLSNTGWLYPAYRLRLMGHDIDDFFSDIVVTHGHDRSVNAVASHFVDGAAVDSLVYEQMVRDSPAIGEGTRVLDRSPPFATPPVVAPPRLDPTLLEAIRRALRDADQSAEGRAVLRPLGIDRFVLVKDEDYAPIREMNRVIRGKR